MTIPITNDLTEGMSDDDKRRLATVFRAVSGVPVDRVVALMMTVICTAADQSTDPAGIWRAICKGSSKELRLLRDRQYAQQH